MVKLSCQKQSTMPRKGVVTPMITYHQMTLTDFFTETQELFESDKPEFLKLLESTIDLYEIVPVSFRNHFYASFRRYLSICTRGNPAWPDFDLVLFSIANSQGEFRNYLFNN